MLFFGCFVLCRLVNPIGIKLPIKKGTSANLDSTVRLKLGNGFNFASNNDPPGRPSELFHWGRSRKTNSLGPTAVSQRLEKLARNNVAKCAQL